jgi:hypothetical protein
VVRQDISNGVAGRRGTGAGVAHLA